MNTDIARHRHTQPLAKRLLTPMLLTAVVAVAAAQLHRFSATTVASIHHPVNGR
ncbi:hypothetical protein [Williamsia sp.]|uniref:hypothetical protein n=1 Tax=Williamsia sp. TaxID=1872085 RepID=UPI002F923ED6